MLIKSPSQEAKDVKALIKALKRFNPTLMEQATTGCLVSRIMFAYTKHANPGFDKKLFVSSAPIWIGKGLNQYSLVDEFLIVSKDSNNPGTLFSCKRSTLDINAGKNKTCELSVKYRSVVARTLKQDDPSVRNTLIVLNDILQLLTLFCHHLVSFKIDQGLHLIIREHSRTKRYVEIYIGGCFNTSVN